MLCADEFLVLRARRRGKQRREQRSWAVVADVMRVLGG